MEVTMLQEVTVLQAVLLGLWIMFVSAMVPSPCLLFNGLTTSLWAGIVLGNIPQAVMVGAAFELIYLGATGASGGIVVQDEVAAVLVSVPLVLISKLELSAAIALAIPIGLLCAQLNNLQQLVMSIPAHMADKFAAKGNTRGVYLSNFIIPYILRIFTRWLPLSVLIYFGSMVAERFVSSIPGFVINALGAVGGVMPAVGMGIIMYTMGNSYLIPFLLGGFFLVQYTGVSTIGATLVGGFLAFLYYLFIIRPKMENHSTAKVPAEEKVELKTVLTKKDLRKTFWSWILFIINCESWERKLGIGFGSALAPCLKKLYKDDPDGYKESLSRELEFFNTETTFGACIPGVALAMEEQKALGAPITGESITTVKTGLMGPFAGIGDSIKWGLLYIMLVALFIPACAETGSAVAAAMPVILFMAICFVIAWFSFNLGYKSGVSSAAQLLRSGLFAELIPVLTVLGMFMIGALGANYIHVTTPLKIATSAGMDFSIQETLDSIAPGLLSLGTLFVSYFVTKKLKNFLWTALIMLAFGIVLGCLGIIV